MPLGELARNVKTDRKNSVSVNPTLLFTRLSGIVQQEDNVEQYFGYDLTHFETPDEAALQNALLTEETDISAKQGTSYLIDGGALLHRIHWMKDMKFCDIANNYVCYVRSNYGSFFDAHDDEMTIKPSEHVRCSALKGCTPNIKIREDSQNPYSKERFLPNRNNKKE